MKIGTIGDIHGKSVWKEFIDKNPHIEKWIFVGDYTDDYPPTTDAQILDNLIEIINFKKENPDKVELLYGNHDHAYAFGSSCSGHRISMKDNLFYLFNANKNLFKFAYQIKNYVWTHAGITRFWYDDIFKPILIKYADKKNKLFEMPIADQINLLSLSADGMQAIMRVGISRGGLGYFGGPLWADMREFDERTILENHHQIVGHSKTRTCIKGRNYTNKKASIMFTDCLDTCKEFYEFEI